MLLSYRKCFPLVGVHDFDQKKACFVPWRVPLQLVQLVLRAGHYVGIYRTGALVQYLMLKC